jgi:hypothetical protein
MTIDARVEPLVRATLDAAVKRDFDKLRIALTGFGEDRTAQQAVELVLAVCAFVLVDIHQGTPNNGQLSGLAEDIADLERWAEPTADEIYVFLTKLLSSEPLAESMPTENIVILGFVTTASLLSSFRKKNEEWWDYLDRVEEAIENR